MSPLNITQPLDSIRYMVYNGYYKVMSNSPKMGHLPTPDKSRNQKPPLGSEISGSYPRSCDAASRVAGGTQSCDWRWPAAPQREVWHESCQMIGGCCEGLPCRWWTWIKHRKTGVSLNTPWIGALFLGMGWPWRHRKPFLWLDLLPKKKQEKSGRGCQGKHGLCIVPWTGKFHDQHCRIEGLLLSLARRREVVAFWNTEYCWISD